MALKSNEKRAIIIAGLTTILGFIFFAIAAGSTEYYHAFLPANLFVSNNPDGWTGQIRVSYGPYRRCVQPNNYDEFCDFIDRSCFPGIDISGQVVNAAGVYSSNGIQPGYGTTLTNCDEFNALRAFHVVALVISGIAGLVMLAAAFKNVSFTFVVILGFVASGAGVIQSVLGGDLITALNTSTFTSTQPSVAFDFGYAFILSVFGWALTFASTGLYIAAKWDEKTDLKQ